METVTSVVLPRDRSPIRIIARHGLAIDIHRSRCAEVAAIATRNVVRWTVFVTDARATRLEA